MKKKAQTGVIGTIFLFIMFVILWFVFLGAWVRDMGQMVVTNNNLVGVEAFIISNLNFFIFIIALLSMIGYMYFASSG